MLPFQGERFSLVYFTHLSYTKPGGRDVGAKLAFLGLPFPSRPTALRFGYVPRTPPAAGARAQGDGVAEGAAKEDDARGGHPLTFLAILRPQKHRQYRDFAGLECEALAEMSGMAIGGPLRYHGDADAVKHREVGKAEKVGVEEGQEVHAGEPEDCRAVLMSGRPLLLRGTLAQAQTLADRSVCLEVFRVLCPAASSMEELGFLIRSHTARA